MTATPSKMYIRRARRARQRFPARLRRRHAAISRRSTDARRGCNSVCHASCHSGRAAQRRRPADVTVAGAERVEPAVFAAEVERVADDHRRGLRAGGQRAFPERLAGLRVELDDVAGDEVDDVEAVLVVGRRGGVEPADAPFPDHLAGVRVEREGGAAVVDEVELAAGEEGGNSSSGRPVKRQSGLNGGLMPLAGR